MIESLVPVGTTVITFEFWVGTVRMFSPTVAYFVPVTVSAGVGSLTSLTLPVVVFAFLAFCGRLGSGRRAGVGPASAGLAPRVPWSALGALEAAETLVDGSRIGDLGVFVAPDTSGGASRGHADERRRNGNACYACRK